MSLGYAHLLQRPKWQQQRNGSSLTFMALSVAAYALTIAQKGIISDEIPYSETPLQGGSVSDYSLNP